MQRLSQPEQKAVAGPVEPDRRIGAIFIDGGPLHVCTGSVVHSKGGDLIMTAAHCLAGASLITFVPGFAGDAAPAPTDMWKADAVYLDPRWVASRIRMPTTRSRESATTPAPASSPARVWR